MFKTEGPLANLDLIKHEGDSRVPQPPASDAANVIKPDQRDQAETEDAVKPINVSNFFQKKDGERSEEEQRMIAESNAKPPPKPKNAHEMSEAIVHVLGKYRLSDPTNVDQWGAKNIFLEQTEAFVKRNEQVKLVLPAFPFKSPNKSVKVLGSLPDAAEEVALAHLNGLAAAIADVYKPGAKIFIVSDGLMYNDLLGVPEEEVWEYGQALRQLAKEMQLSHLDFLCLRDLKKGESNPIPNTKEYYLNDAAPRRQDIVDQFLPQDYDVDTEISNDADTTLTFRGYLKFLELDLEKEDPTESRTQFKKRNEKIAKQMMGRGKAFACAINETLPGHIRLSIHCSTETTKLSISLIPQDAQIQTPWHCSLVRAVDGTVTTSHASLVNPVTHELIFKNGHPSYFRERSDLFDWPDMDLNFDYLYPTGVMITARRPDQSYSLKDVPMQKVRNLSTQCSPVVLRGFSDTTSDEVYTQKAYEAGEPAGWKFGIKTSVKDSRGKNDDPVTAIVTSSEAMPMHFDGFFFLVPKVQPDGSIKNVSSQPGFQYFSSITPASPGSGYTLFASSPLLFKHLPAPHTVEDLRDLTWDCRHSSNWEEHMNKMPLVRPHPTTGEDCLRYHEPWPQWKTQFTYNRISIENGPQSYIDLLDEMLYDRRVTIWFEWEQGDILFSDNIKMLHTRTAFSGTEDRELWRIHVN